MVRFDDFMQAALYHPERGYYTSSIKTVGNGGDFTTTPQLSGSLARAIARTFCESGERNLIEVGPGSGQLSAAVRQALPWTRRFRLNQHLVETSPILQQQQQARNPRAGHHTTLSEALAACRGEAFIFSNELVDAFPVRIFRKSYESESEPGFDELFLEKTNQGIREIFQPATQLPDSSLLSANAPAGQRIEVHESYHQWIKSSLLTWKSGQLLTIDYALPARPSPTGSLRGYFRQERLTGSALYQNAGHIDLTADVSFGDLQRWGRACSLETTRHCTQAEFLAPHLRSTPADQFLTDPEGAGTAFEVLLQSRTTS